MLWKMPKPKLLRKEIRSSLHGWQMPLFFPKQESMTVISVCPVGELENNTKIVKVARETGEEENKNWEQEWHRYPAPTQLTIK